MSTRALAWPGSALVHAALVGAFVVFGARPVAPPVQIETPAIPIEIIDQISDQTNITAIAPPQVEEPPPPEVPPAPQGTPRETQTPAPAPPAPDATALAAKKKKDDARRRNEDLDRYAALIDQAKKDIGAAAAPATANAPQGPRPRAAVGAASGLSASELDAIRAHVQRCWRAPADMAFPERLVVKVRVNLNAQGKLGAPPVLVEPATLAGAPPPVIVAAEAALRAVRVCEPFPVAPNRTERVEGVIIFDPTLMAQGR